MKKKSTLISRYSSKIIFTLLLFSLSISCSSDTNSASEMNYKDGVGGSLAVFALKGNYLYAVDEQTLQVFSLISLQQPVKVNQVNVGFDIETLFSLDDKLYIGSRNGMFIYSIVNPENPIRLSAIQHFTACDPVVSTGDFTYVTLHSNQICGNNTNVLEVYNTQDATNPQLIHSRNLSFPKGLGLYQNHLFVCDDVIKIFNVDSPQNPVLVHSINRLCFDVIITGDNLYAIGTNGLYRYQLNPDNINNIVFKSQISF